MYLAKLSYLHFYGCALPGIRHLFMRQRIEYSHTCVGSQLDNFILMITRMHVYLGEHSESIQTCSRSTAPSYVR
jgi:hypothetical protein